MVAHQDWRQKGYRLRSLELSFFVKADVDELHKRFGAVGFETRGRSSSFAALPENLKGGSGYLTGGFHQCEDGKAHWTLALYLAPSGPPPPDMVEASERVGGYPQVLGRIGTAWAGKSPELHIVAVYDVVSARFAWKKALMEASSPKFGTTVTRGKVRHRLEPVVWSAHWDVAPAFGVVKSIGMITVDNEVSSIHLNGQGRRRITMSLVSDLDEELWAATTLIQTYRR